MAAAVQSQRQQQQQQQQQPRVLYHRPASVGVRKQSDEWEEDDGAVASGAQVGSAGPTRSASALTSTARVQRAISQHVVWAKDAGPAMARPAPRPASAGSAAAAAAMTAATASSASPSSGITADDSISSGGVSSSISAAPGGLSGGNGNYIPRVYGGSPNLNAAAAAIADRQTVVEALASLRPQCRCCRDGGAPPTSIGGNRRDVEGLSDEVRKLRAELLACQEQNRLLRTERQRLEEDLSRYRTNLVKAEEILNSRERSLSPNACMSRMFRSPSTTALVSKLREQLAAQQNQTESLRVQLDEVVRGTRATRMAELQAEVKAQERELGRQSEMLKIMRRRMEEAEARATEVQDRSNTTERLARLQGPLVALQQAIADSEAKFSAADPGSGAVVGSPSASTATGTSTSGKATATAGDVGDTSTSSPSPKGVSSPERISGGNGGSEGQGTPPPSPLATRQQHQASPSSNSIFSVLSGGKTLSSSRIKRTMAALGDAHRALLSQATLLSEVFPPGLTTEQLSIRAALRPATSGAPEVLRYLRHHVHKLVEVLSGLPGNRLEMKQEEDDPAASASGGSSKTSRNTANNRNNNNGRGGNGQRAAPRTSMTGQTLRAAAAAAATAKGRGGGGGGSGSAASAGGPPAEELDPWAFLSDLLDFVRWLRGLDNKILESRPDLEGGLEQLSSVVGICDLETRRLLGKLEGALSGNGA